MILIAIALLLLPYLLVSWLVIRWSVRWAREHGRRRWVWGGLAAAVMYNLLFWDLIPTLLLHKYYCNTKAGFWAYETPEQWLRQNPRMSETLRNFPRSHIEEVDGWQTYQFNQRLRLEIQQFEIAHAIGRTERRVRDVSTSKVLVREVHYSLGWGSASFVSGGGIEGMRRALVFSMFRDGDRRCGFAVSPEQRFWKVEQEFRSIGGRK